MPGEQYPYSYYYAYLGIPHLWKGEPVKTKPPKPKKMLLSPEEARRLEAERELAAQKERGEKTLEDLTVVNPDMIGYYGTPHRLWTKGEVATVAGEVAWQMIKGRVPTGGFWSRVWWLLFGTTRGS